MKKTVLALLFFTFLTYTSFSQCGCLRIYHAVKMKGQRSSFTYSNENIASVYFIFEDCRLVIKEKENTLVYYFVSNANSFNGNLNIDNNRVYKSIFKSSAIRNEGMCTIEALQMKNNIFIFIREKGEDNIYKVIP